MTGAQMGLWGGILGSVIGIVGGAIGSWASIRNCENDLQRKFMIRMVIYFWAFAVVFFGVLILEIVGLLPMWFRMSVWVLFMILLGPIIMFTNRRYRELGDEGNATRGRIGSQNIRRFIRSIFHRSF
ncbi:MAG: hypothetical protein ABIC40_07550 [bacterium]